MAASFVYEESPPEFPRSKGVVTLTGVEIPDTKETGLPFGSPANATIDKLRALPLNWCALWHDTKKDAIGVCVAFMFNGFPRPTPYFAGAL